jgi:hypothetical protein
MVRAREDFFNGELEKVREKWEKRIRDEREIYGEKGQKNFVKMYY